MKIKMQLPQFRNETALLLVTAKQHGVLYVAHDGALDEAASLEEPKARYSDHEGFFVSSGTGHTASGAVYEENKQEVIRKFAKKIVAEAERLVRERGVNSIYLFVPGYVEKEFIRDLPNALKGLVRHTFTGNHVDEHPFKLLEKIQAERF